MPDTYTKATADGEVLRVEDVRVSVTKTVAQETVLTLAQIDRNLSELRRQRDDLDAGIAKLEAMRVGVETEAKKVVLKVAVPEPEPAPAVEGGDIKA